MADNDLPAFIWLILLFLLSSPIIYLVGRLIQRQSFSALSYVSALVVLLVAWWPFTQCVRQMAFDNPTVFTYGNIHLQMDGLGLLLAAVSLILGTVVVLYSGPYISREAGQEKYYALLVAMIGVMIGLACAHDLFNLWVWFEAMAVTSYLLVAFYHQQPASLEAGIKYLVQSATGSILVLLGISLVLSQTGSLNLDEVRAEASGSPVFLVASALFVIGFGVKAALVPLHTWLPDAHSQAPSGISAMLSGVVIEAGLVAMLKVLMALANISPSWDTILMGFGALNMMVGNLMALRQTQVKRLLAYSSLAHVGYILLGLGIALNTGDPDGAQGGFFHLFNHGLMKGLAFLSVGTLLYTLTIANGQHGTLSIDDLGGAARRYPLIALTLSIAVLSLGGLPPFAGFMSKWQIFAAGFQTGNKLIAFLVIFAALNSVLSLAYYAPLVNTVYRERSSDKVLVGVATPMVMRFPLIVLALLILILGIWPSLLNWLTVPAGQALLAAFGS